jgi:hypothetical protein
MVGDENPRPLNYLSQMIAVLKAPENPQVGANYDEMCRVLPIIQKLEALPEGSTSVLLEDAQHAEIVKRLKSIPFMANDVALFDMINCVSCAEVMPVEEVKAG